MPDLVLLRLYGEAVREREGARADQRVLQHLSLEQHLAVRVLDQIAGLEGVAVPAEVILAHAGLLKAVEARLRHSRFVQRLALFERLDRQKDARDRRERTGADHHDRKHAADLGVGRLLGVLRIVVHVDGVADLVALVAVDQLQCVGPAVHGVGDVRVVQLLVVLDHALADLGDRARRFQIVVGFHAGKDDADDDQDDADRNEEPRRTGVSHELCKFAFHTNLLNSFRLILDYHTFAVSCQGLCGASVQTPSHSQSPQTVSRRP